MYSHWLSQFASRTRQLFVALMLASLVASCSPLDIAKSLVGGGPNVNGQIGAENNQGINIKSTRAAPTVTVRPKARVDTIDQSTTNNVSIPPWVLLVIVCLAAGGAIGWVDNIVRFFRRKTNA